MFAFDSSENMYRLAQYIAPPFTRVFSVDVVTNILVVFDDKKTENYPAVSRSVLPFLSSNNSPLIRGSHSLSIDTL
jgi:hypothetical protein